jgi:hypothetical protein
MFRPFLKFFQAPTILAALFCGTLFAQKAGSPSPSRIYVEFEPLDTVTMQQGKNARLELVFHVRAGYHIISSRPTTPELIPASLAFTLPKNLVVAKVQYPAGELVSLPFDPTQKLSVYAGDVVVKAVLMAQPQSNPGVYSLHGEFTYQACDNNACYPPKKLPIEFDVKVSQNGTGVHKRRGQH